MSTGRPLAGDLSGDARINSEGPGFPHGKPGEANAISVERVVLVKAAEG